MVSSPSGRAELVVERVCLRARGLVRGTEVGRVAVRNPREGVRDSDARWSSRIRSTVRPGFCVGVGRCALSVQIHVTPFLTHELESVTSWKRSSHLEKQIGPTSAGITALTVVLRRWRGSFPALVMIVKSTLLEQ